MLASFCPEEARQKDNTNFQIRLVFATYTALGFPSSPIVGYMLSTGVFSKIFLVTGMLTCGGFFAVMGFFYHVPARIPFFIANLVCHLTEALGASICSTCFYSIITAELAATINRRALDAQLIFDLIAIAYALSLTNIVVGRPGKIRHFAEQHGTCFFHLCNRLRHLVDHEKWVGDGRYSVDDGARLAALGLYLMRPVETAGVEVTLKLQLSAQCPLGLGMSAMYTCSTLHEMH